MDADEKLIEAVREFPCLWLVSSKFYKEAVAKDNAWREIGTQVCYNNFMNEIIIVEDA